MATSKKNAKATKKFEKKHLKGTIEKRKATAKIKQRQQVKDKKAAKRSRDDEFLGSRGGSSSDKRGDAAAASGAKKGGAVAASEMSVDDFFKGGFEILDSGKPDKKSAGKLGKRKRDGPAAAAAASSSKGGDDSDEEQSDLDLSEGENLEDDDEDLSDGDDGDDENAGMSKAAMDALAQEDPEFYQFLRENDPEALEFDQDADLAEIDELSGGDEDNEEDDEKEEEQPKKKRKKTKTADETGSGHELTREMVAKWKKSLEETRSLRTTRQVVLAFRSAAHLNEDDDNNNGSRGPRYTISSPEAFHDILLVALKQVPEVLGHHLPVKESAAGKTYVSTESSKFKTLSILIKSFAGSAVHLLSTLSDDASLRLALSSLEPLLPYLLSFRKLLRALVKTVVAFWSQPASGEATRVAAFLVLRRLVVIGDRGVRESVLRAAYQGLLQGSRATTANTVRGINLAKNSAAELWGVDPAVGYTTAFSAIRQLAIHLRNSIVHNANDAFRRVYNWQYVHAVDFWSRVLSEQCRPLREAEAGRESPLRPLVYPLVQVALGAMRLIPTAAYFPLRFQIARSLLRLARATATYIPLASPLLEVLASAEMKKPARPSTVKPLDFSVAYRAPKSYLRTRVYQDGVGEQVAELLAEHLVLWSTNIAFPELALPVTTMLKRWIKEARKKGGSNKNKGKKNGAGAGGNSRVVSGLALLVRKVEANGEFIAEKRSRVDFAPSDRAQVDAFLKDFEWEKTPLGAFVASQRAMRAEKQKMMEDARREDEKKRKEELEKLNGDGDDGESGDEVEGESEEEEDEEEDEDVSEAEEEESEEESE